MACTVKFVTPSNYFYFVFLLPCRLPGKFEVRVCSLTLPEIQVLFLAAFTIWIC